LCRRGVIVTRWSGAAALLSALRKIMHHWTDPNGA
jgi:hypothetical protein